MKYLKILDGNIPKYKCGAEVVGASIAAGGSLLGGLIGSSSSSSNVSNQLGAQSAENAKNRDWQTSEAEKARAFQQGILNQQNQFSQQLQDRQAYYQSPVYQSEQLRQAGINPAVYFGQQSSFSGSSAPSAPSAPSPAQVGSVSGLNPIGFQPFGTNIGSILSGIGNVIQSSASAKKMGIESNWLPEKLKKEIRLLDRQSTLQQVLAVGQSIHNEREKTLLPFALKQAEADLYKTLADADLSSTKVQTEDSIRKVNYAIEGVQNAIKSLNEKEIEKLGLEMPFYVDLLKAKINDLRASASESDSQSDLNKANSEQVRFFNELYSNKEVRSSLCKQLKLAGEAAERANEMSKEQANLLRSQIANLEKATSNYEIQMWSNIINQTINTASNAVGQFTRFALVKEFMNKGKPAFDASAGNNYYMDQSNGLIFPK